MADITDKILSADRTADGALSKLKGTDIYVNNDDKTQLVKNSLSDIIHDTANDVFTEDTPCSREGEIRPNAIKKMPSAKKINGTTQESHEPKEQNQEQNNSNPHGYHKDYKRIVRGVGTKAAKAALPKNGEEWDREAQREISTGVKVSVRTAGAAGAVGATVVWSGANVLFHKTTVRAGAKNIGQKIKQQGSSGLRSLVKSSNNAVRNFTADGSQDLGMDAVVKTKNAVYQTKTVLTTAKDVVVVGFRVMSAVVKFVGIKLIVLGIVAIIVFNTIASIFSTFIALPIMEAGTENKTILEFSNTLLLEDDNLETNIRAQLKETGKTLEGEYPYTDHKTAISILYAHLGHKLTSADTEALISLHGMFYSVTASENVIKLTTKTAYEVMELLVFDDAQKDVVNQLCALDWGDENNLAFIGSAETP